jgi:hypothetical protein
VLSLSLGKEPIAAIARAVPGLACQEVPNCGGDVDGRCEIRSCELRIPQHGLRRTAQSLTKATASSTVAKLTRMPASSSVIGCSLTVTPVQIPGDSTSADRKVGMSRPLLKFRGGSGDDYAT